MVDYRLLLKRYMLQVIECESVSFIDHWNYGEKPLTKKEIKQLKNIEKEVRSEQ